MSGIFAPKSDGYVEVPLLEGEHMIRQQTASVDGKSIWGGQLVLTDQRLLFRPLSVKGATKLINDGIDFLPDDLGVLGKLVSKALDYSTAYGEGKAGAVATRSIQQVAAGRNAGLFHPPSLVLTLEDGTRVELGILRSRGSANADPRNNAVRDEWLGLIRQHLSPDGLG
ncbi:MAG TPA: hypothetical protein VFR99_12930 [Marmoricola sp.]|nr:hypothetical protein [Marmoricola sp.]